MDKKVLWLLGYDHRFDKEDWDPPEITTVDQKIQSLIHSIEREEDILDQDVIDTVYHFTPSDSCETAAQGYFALVSSILYFRPSVEKKLLKKAMEPLYFLGIENPSEIMLWVEDYTNKEKKYISPTTYGMKWLKNFATKSPIVEQILHEFRNEYEE